MSKSIRRVCVALIVPTVFALSVPATADPRPGLAGQATCSDGNSYDVVVNGSGYYLPAHVVTSTQVFKPVAFGEFTTTVTDPDGHVLAVETSQPTAQGGGKVLAHNPKPYLDCSVTLAARTPEGFTASLRGTVTGFFPGG